MTAPPFDLATAHRWFAIESNNAAWDLIEKPDRSADETEQMLHAAHAACLHWREVGEPINELRAQCLLANAYLAADNPAAALTYANKCVELSQSDPAGQTDFDRSTAYLCASNAYAGVGDQDQARKMQRQAIDLALQLQDAEEQQVAKQMIAAGNWYGLDVSSLG